MQNDYYSSSTTYRLNKEDASHHCHHISRCLQLAGFFLAAAINRCAWSVWGQKQVRYYIKSEAYHASPAICPERIAPYFCRITPRYIRVGLLNLIFNRFLSFLSLPYAPHTNAEVRGDPLHSSRPKPRHTSNTRICLHASADIHTTHGHQSAPWPQAAERRRHPKSTWARSVLRGHRVEV